jgi:hypothetical protein
VNTTMNRSVPIITASSSVDSTGKLHISMCNTHATSTHTVAISLTNAPSYTSCTGTIITGPAYNSYNNFDVAEAVNIKAFTGATLSGNMINVTMPAHSVVTLELTSPDVGIRTFGKGTKNHAVSIETASNNGIVIGYAGIEPVSFSVVGVDGKILEGTTSVAERAAQQRIVWRPAIKSGARKVAVVNVKAGECAVSRRMMLSN